MIYVIIFGLVIAGGLIYYLTIGKNPAAVENQSPQRTIKPEENLYDGLSGQIFGASPEQIGLTTTTEEKPDAMIMDWRIMDWSIGGDGTATLVSIVDGNASIYLSSGGGIIGGYGHENCRRAAIDFVNIGQIYFTKMVPVESFPLPKTDNVRFYILTNKGKYSIEEEIEKIENDRSEWAQLFYEGNKVITAKRGTPAGGPTQEPPSAKPAVQQTKASEGDPLPLCIQSLSRQVVPVGQSLMDTTNPERITFETEALHVTIRGGIEKENLSRS